MSFIRPSRLARQSCKLLQHRSLKLELPSRRHLGLVSLLAATPTDPCASIANNRLTATANSFKMQYSQKMRRSGILSSLPQQCLPFFHHYKIANFTTLLSDIHANWLGSYTPNSNEVPTTDH